MQLNGKTITSEVARFELSIAFISESTFEFQGTLCNRTYGFALDFNSIGQLVASLDMLFDYVHFPMAAQETRCFIDQPKKKKQQKLPLEPTLPSNYYVLKTLEPMQQANFILFVQFRHNATWQGVLTHVDTGTTQRFSSELELIKLLIAALS